MLFRSRGAKSNRVVQAANTYVQLYGMYALTIVVDRQGRVLAVNDQDAAGKPIQTDWLYDKNFASASWFQDAVAGRFLVAPGSALTGTVVEDAQPSEDVTRVYNDSRPVVTFSAPIRDTSGQIIGVWHNVASFTVVDDVLRAQ